MAGFLVELSIDLNGSKLGPPWRHVTVVVAPPEEWSDERLRQEAAAHYGVSLGQVSRPTVLGDPA